MKKSFLQKRYWETEDRKWLLTTFSSIPHLPGYKQNYKSHWIFAVHTGCSHTGQAPEDSSGPLLPLLSVKFEVLRDLPHFNLP